MVQALFGLAHVQEEEARLRQEVVRRGFQVQRALAVPTSVALANREIEELDAVLWRFSQDDGRDLDIQSVAVLDLGGRVLAHTNPTVFGFHMIAYAHEQRSAGKRGPCTAPQLGPNTPISPQKAPFLRA